VIAELNKMAMIHLYSHGFDGEDLMNFDLKLSNPSSIAQQQKLELIRARFEIAGTAPEGLVDRRWIRKNVMGLTDADIDLVEEGKKEDKVVDMELEATTAPGEEGGGEEGGAEEPAGEEGGGGLFAADIKDDGELLTALPGNGENKDDPDDEDDDDDLLINMSIKDDDAPQKAQAQIRNVFNEPIKKSRKVTAGPGSTHMPDFLTMTSTGKSGRTQDSLNKPFDDDYMISPFKEARKPDDVFWDSYVDTKLRHNAKMTNEMESVLNNLQNAIGIKRHGVLTEADDDITLDMSEDDSLINDVINEEI
jgi:hypothetical protein